MSKPFKTITTCKSLLTFFHPDLYLLIKSFKSRAITSDNKLTNTYRVSVSACGDGYKVSGIRTD